jgi:hypothetical protein
LNQGVVRRLVFLKVSDGTISEPYDFFSINAERVPQFMVDVDIHNLTLITSKDLPKETGWGTMPTPTF